MPRIVKFLRYLPIPVCFGLILILKNPLFAVDSENCLMCHRYRGLARVEKDGTYRVFYINEELFNKGPHSRVTCKGCHVDIEEIPHNKAEKVNCLVNCHIEEPNREILFSHKGVQKSLDKSVHSKLDSTGELKKYQEDIPSCKDCHDSPLFRPINVDRTMRDGISEKATGRCAVCHEDPNFVKYFYSHVTSRLHKARDPREVIEICGQCHSDPDFLKRHDMPNVVSSYLETYHGKAILFGSKRAPDCLDCHAVGNNVHEMHGKNEVTSSVYVDTRPKTCSQIDCHPKGNPQLAEFKVHASPHDAKRYPVEKAIAVGFVALTLGTLIPMLLISMLSLIRELFPSKQAKEEIKRLEHIAEKLAKENKGIKRFTIWQRTEHAILVISFMALSLTGLPMKFPETFWAPILYQAFGGIEVAPIIHRIAGVTMLLGFAIHIFTVFLDIHFSIRQGGKKGIKAWVETIISLPMVPTIQDGKDLLVMFKYILFISPVRPAYRRFSWKEKFDYLAIFWGVPLLGLTGFILWGEELFSHYIPGWVINISYLAHSDEALLAVSFIFLIHILNVLRPFSSPLTGMLTGKINPNAFAEEHGGQIDDELGLEDKNEQNKN